MVRSGAGQAFSPVEQSPRINFVRMEHFDTVRRMQVRLALPGNQMRCEHRWREEDAENSRIHP